MTRAAAALLAALVLSLTGACGESQSGDSVTDNQDNEPPQPSTSQSS